MARKRKAHYRKRESAAYARGVKKGKEEGFWEGWEAKETHDAVAAEEAAAIMARNPLQPTTAEAREITDAEVVETRVGSSLPLEEGPREAPSWLVKRVYNREVQV